MFNQALAQVAPTAAELARYTGLHAAAAQGDVALIKQLLAAGANVNATDPYGRTPMHVAATSLMTQRCWHWRNRW
jgi:ankyrin repeat protein